MSHAASQISAPEDECAATSPPPPKSPTGGHPAPAGALLFHRQVLCPDGGTETSWNVIYVFKKVSFTLDRKNLQPAGLSAAAIHVLLASLALLIPLNLI